MVVADYYVIAWQANNPFNKLGAGVAGFFKNNNLVATGDIKFTP